MNKTMKFAEWYMNCYPDTNTVSIDRLNDKVYLETTDSIILHIMMTNKMSWTMELVAHGIEKHYDLTVTDLGHVAQKYVDMVEEKNLDNHWMHKKMGKLFSDKVEVYMLCQVEVGRFCLVSIKSGNRLNDPSSDKKEVFLDSGMVEVKGWEVDILQTIGE